MPLGTRNRIPSLDGLHAISIACVLLAPIFLALATSAAGLFSSCTEISEYGCFS
jgi:hypothetical protein